LSSQICEAVIVTASSIVSDYFDYPFHCKDNSMRRTQILTAFISAICLSGASALAQPPHAPSIVGFPPVLEQLQLTTDQRQQVNAIVTKYDALFESAWQEFGSSYQKTLKAEAVLLAAIEDGFTDAQRKQAHEERRKRIASSPIAPPVSTAGANSGNASANDEKTPSGVPLTSEQVAAMGKLQEKYHVHLTPLTRDIQICHARLLAIEMDKFLELQKVLTKQQLDKLSQLLQSGEAVKIAGLNREETK
jgi:hypothetical protein